MPLTHLFLANTFFTPFFCPNVLSLSKDYPALQAFSLGTRVFCLECTIPVSTPPYSTAKKADKLGRIKGIGGGGGEREENNFFSPPRPLSSSFTLTPTPGAAISTLSCLTNKNKPLFLGKHAQKPKLASMHFLRGCPHLMLGNQCLGISTKWCCVHTMNTRYVTVYIRSYSISPCQTPF